MCATGLLRRTEDGGYVNSATAQDLLASDEADSWGHILVGWKEVYYPAFAQLTTALKAGTNTALDAYPRTGTTLYQRLAHQPQLEEVFHRAMTAFTLRSLDALVARPEFASVGHLLDVGGDDGTTSFRLAERHPELTATVFDLPTVSRLASDHTDRVTLHPGDIFEDAFPTGADAVLFSHVLEIFSPEQISRLMRKAYDALPPGGKVFVYGYNVSDDETDGVFSARLGLYFNVLASGQGMAYPAVDYENWLTGAGFDRITTVRGFPYEHGLTVGEKHSS
ncbi:methyltransferase [Streptomyces sp. NPDC048417]|uniref:methyltransferase n=1 Tax=Streptomyces sp. NPDC048417 TaxID=3155387 RepID=UPI003432A90B